MTDFNSKRFRRGLERAMNGGKKRRRRRSWLWDRHSNGYSFPSHEEYFTFNWGKFATLLAGIIILLLVIISMILIWK